MVEAHDKETEEEQGEKSFMEVPAILDQVKAASLITNGTHVILHPRDASLCVRRVSLDAFTDLLSSVVFSHASIILSFLIYSCT